MAGLAAGWVGLIIARGFASFSNLCSGDALDFLSAHWKRGTDMSFSAG